MTPRELFDCLTMPDGYGLTHDPLRLDDPQNTSFMGMIYPQDVWPGPFLPEDFQPAPEALVFVEFYADDDVAEAIFESGPEARRHEPREGCDRYAVLPSGSPLRMGSPVFRIGSRIAQVTCLSSDSLCRALTNSLIKALRDL